MSQIETREVGSVYQLSRFPVKGMAGEHPESLTVLKHSIEGDRNFAFHKCFKCGCEKLTMRDTKH